MVKEEVENSDAPPESTPARGHEVDARTLAEVKNLQVRVRIVADSALSGVHRSKNRGTSVEFAEHKEYSPGDDIRHLDWRAFARFDRDFIKKFEDEASLRTMIVLDSSGTMNYPPEPNGRLSKIELARTVAGALAHLLSAQGDAPGLAEFSESLSVSLPPRARRGHLQQMLSKLGGITPEGKTQFADAVRTLLEGLSRRHFIVVLTDLLDGGLEAMPALGRLRSRGHDIVVFHCLDADELEFPFEESTLFTSLEEEDRAIRVDARSIREAYLHEVQRFCAEAEMLCRKARIDYYLLRTDRAPGGQLARFLATRMQSTRGVR